MSVGDPAAKRQLIFGIIIELIDWFVGKEITNFDRHLWMNGCHHIGIPSVYLCGTIGVVLGMSTSDTNVDGSIPASICFLLEQETLSALLQSTQL